MANYTKIPNVVIDDYMRTLKPSEFLVLICIIRKTIGWHKAADAIALSQITGATGMTKPTVIKSLKRLISAGLVESEKRPRRASIYRFASKNILLAPSKNSLPQLVKKFNHAPSKNSLPTKEIIKKSKERANLSEKKDNFFTPPISLENYKKENGPGAEVKGPLARDNQGLLKAASQFELEPSDDELEADFKKRLEVVQILSSLTRGLKREM